MSTLATERPAQDLSTHVVAFCRALRRRGVQVTASEAVDLLRALEVVDLGDREEVRFAVRSVLATGRDSLPVIDDLFNLLWGALGERLAGAESATISSKDGGFRKPPTPEATLKGLASLEEWATETESAEEFPAPGASPEERVQPDQAPGPRLDRRQCPVQERHLTRVPSVAHNDHDRPTIHERAQEDPVEGPQGFADPRPARPLGGEASGFPEGAGKVHIAQRRGQACQVRRERE